jgi:hypothetical protein
MLACGLIGVTAAGLTFRYATHDGGELSYAMAAASAFGYAALGALVLRGRFRRVAPYYAGALLLLLVLPWLPRSGPLSFIKLSSIALFAMVVGQPGKVRLVVTGVVLAALAVVFVVRTGKMLQRPPLTGPPVSLEVVLVDDTVEPFAELDPAHFLPGMSLAREDVDGRTTTLLLYQPEASIERRQLMARVASFVQERITLPPGTRIAWGSDSDPPAKGPLRSYVLRGPPIFTGKDVVDAELVDSADVGILVSLSDEAGQRLQGATRAHRGGRLAIVLDGAVESAPVVRSEIAGGQVVISLGSTSPAARDQAELLVGALGGRAFRFP